MQGRFDRMQLCPGIDVYAAMEKLGDIDLFCEIVEDYYNEADEKIELIRKLEETEDITNYTVEVHALKSSSRLIGAEELGDFAYAMEMCGKENDIANIHKKTDRLLRMYKNLAEEIGQRL